MNTIKSLCYALLLITLGVYVVCVAVTTASLSNELFLLERTDSIYSFKYEFILLAIILGVGATACFSYAFVFLHTIYIQIGVWKEARRITAWQEYIESQKLEELYKSLEQAETASVKELLVKEFLTLKMAVKSPYSFNSTSTINK